MGDEGAGPALGRRLLPVALMIAAALGTGEAQPPSPETPSELKGRVTEVRGETVVVAVDSPLVPGAGDRVELFFRLPDGEAASVGTWRVTSAGPGRVEASQVEVSGQPQVGYEAVIHATAPRAVVATPPAGGKDAAAPPAGGAAAVEAANAPIGLLPDGQGRTLWEGREYVIESSPGLQTVIPISLRPLGSLVASTHVSRVIAGVSPRGGAGLALMTDRETLQWRDGDVLLGRALDGTLAAVEWSSGRWVTIPVGQPPRSAETSGVGLAIRKEGRTYRFHSGPHVLGTWESPHPDPKWVFLFASPGVRAGFVGWIVDDMSTR